MKAYRRGDVAELDRILASEASRAKSVDTPSRIDTVFPSIGMTLLQLAVKANRMEIARSLLFYGAAAVTPLKSAIPDSAVVQVEPDTATRELLVSIEAADAALLASSRESTTWTFAKLNTISEYNENYRCTVLAIGTSGDDANARMYIRFIAKTDGSLGSLQLPQASRLTLGSLDPVAAESAVYAVEEPMSQYAGTLVFNIVPLLTRFRESGLDGSSAPSFQFMYGESGYSAATLLPYASSRYGVSLGETTSIVAAADAPSADALKLKEYVLRYYDPIVRQCAARGQLQKIQEAVSKCGPSIISCNSVSDELRAVAYTLPLHHISIMLIFNLLK